mgnify:CR=1 FL=1
MKDAPDWADGMLFNLERNARYHRARSAFYDSYSRWITFANIAVGASFPFVVVTASLPGYLVIASASVALVNALALAFDINKRTVDHQILSRQFKDLKVEIAEKIEEKQEISEAYFERRRNEIEQHEYPIFNVLDDLMYIEVCKSLGRTVPDEVSVGFWPRMFKHWIRFEGRT